MGLPGQNTTVYKSGFLVLVSFDLGILITSLETTDNTEWARTLTYSPQKLQHTQALARREKVWEIG